MPKQKWTYEEHSSAIADTGDYSYYIAFTNGKYTLQSSSEEIEEEDLQKFCDLLNLMPDLWCRELDLSQMENSILNRELKELKKEKSTSSNG